MDAYNHKAIYFLRSADIGIDSRLRRYQEALAQSGRRYRSVYWDRGGPGKTDATAATIRYVTQTGFGRRQATALAFGMFNLFVLKSLWQNRKDIAAVHAVDLDTALPAAFFCALTGIPLVFDLYDSFVDSRSITGPLRAALDWLERGVIRVAQMAIIADPGRVTQHPPIPDQKLLVIENVPVLHGPIPLKRARTHDDPLRLGYMGTLEAFGRGIEDLCAVVERLDFVTLDIVGTGALEQRIIAKAKRCQRIRFHGPKEHAEGLKIMANTDILVGLYYSIIPNHAFAAPNKYYEHLLLGMPMLTSAHTPPGKKVSANKTGWAVEDNEAAIAAALTEAHQSPNLIAQYEANAAAIWRAQFANYFDQILVGAYCQRIASIVAPKGK